MSGTLEQIQELRKFAAMSSEQKIGYAVMKMEQQLMSGLTDVRSRVEGRHAAEWPDREDVREQLAGLDETEQWEQFEQAMGALEMDVVRVGLLYHELALKNDDVRPFLNAFKSLLVTVHSPVIQESLLLAVAEPFRPRVRGQFEQFGRILWGWYAVTCDDAALDGACAEIDDAVARTYLGYAADRWGMDPRELAERLLEEDGEAVEAAEMGGATEEEANGRE